MKKCICCGRKFISGVSHFICSNSCAKIAQMIRRKGHR